MAIPLQDKDPAEKFDYRIDWAGVVGSDAIVASSWDVEEGTVTIGTPPSAYDDNTATVWVAGGEAGEIAVLTNTVTTSGGRIYEQSIKIRIVEK